MDKIVRFRKIIREVLTDFVIPRTSPSSTVETQLLIDTENDHYQVVRVGWNDRSQVFLVVFHLDIKDGKIWLQQNTSDYDIVKDLEAKGISKSDIVLGIHSPGMRQFTEYAVA